MITVGFIATMAREATLSRHNNAIEGRAAATGDGYSGRTANGIVNGGGANTHYTYVYKCLCAPQPERLSVITMGKCSTC